jgi:hypothetical protein
LGKKQTQRYGITPNISKQHEAAALAVAGSSNTCSVHRWVFAGLGLDTVVKSTDRF